MAAHHAAQRQHLYSIPPPPPPTNVFNDELRLPSIKDLAFKYERPRQETSQNSPSAPQQPAEFAVSSNQERSRPQSQSWGRSPHPAPPAISTHHPQQQHTPPLSAGHELSSRHDSGGYLTPGMPLSAQTTHLPGSVITGPGIRNDEHSNKRTRPSPVIAPRDSRPNHVVYPPQYQTYQPPIPPQSQSPYHQMNSVPAVPSHPSVPPSPHPHMQHQPSPAPAHPSYSYQQPQQPPYIQRSSPQHVSPTGLSTHPTHSYHPGPSQHTHAPQQHQAPPPSQPSQPHHSVPYPSPSPSVSQEQHWEQHHHQPQPQHAPPVHSVQHHPVQHAPPPPPANMHHGHYSHPPPPPPMTPITNHPQQPPPHQQPQQHTNYAQSVPHSSASHSLARAIQPVITTTVVPTPEVDSRTYTANTAPAKSPSRESTMSEIVKLCAILYDFASRYSSLSSALPHIQPSQTEVMEMARRANDVARLLEALRRMDEPETKHIIADEMSTSPDDNRPPKRPWEDMAQDGQAPSDDRAGMFPESSLVSPAAGQSTAEQDMELIRSKRATTTGSSASASGQPKSKYRKRSRATPPGKCHSCNIRETPEWRRGPDGARTLCNACGLHYAKLMRKQAKLSGNQSGEVLPKIDMETLKASTKAAEAEKGIVKADAENSVPSTSAPPPQHHQGSFQVMSIVSPIEGQGSPTATPSDPTRLPAHHQTILPPPANAAMHPPPPPWVTRTYTPSDQFQSQSFMRTNHISPR